MSEKQEDLPKMVKDADNKKEENYILQDNAKTKFGATFIIIVLVILALAVIATSMFIDFD